MKIINVATEKTTVQVASKITIKFSIIDGGIQSSDGQYITDSSGKVIESNLVYTG